MFERYICYRFCFVSRRQWCEHFCTIDTHIPSFADVQELFSCLEEIQSKLNDHEDREDIQFLKQLFHNSDFQQALSLHNQVAEVHQQEPLPLPEATNAELLAAEVPTVFYWFDFFF